MKREPRSEIVSVRLTPAERARLDELGGATEIVRRALKPHWPTPPPVNQTLANTRTFTVWDDGTVGESWPALVTA